MIFIVVEIFQISIFDNKNNQTYIFLISVVIAIQNDKIFIFKSDGLTLGTSQDSVFPTIQNLLEINVLALVQTETQLKLHPYMKAN